jgi:hypothetical protein
MRRHVRCILAVVLVSLLGVPVHATPPSPIVSSLFAPIEGDVTLSNGDVVNFTGEVHIVTHVVFSDTGVPSVGIWANLVHVRGTSATTGTTYLVVGAGNVGWVGANPGPPDIPEQTFTFALVSLQINPGPPEVPPSPILPVFLRDFHFGVEAENYGVLQTVEASFVSD